MKDRAFFFGSYEGYRLDAGKNIIQGVPSAAAWARAVPAIAGLRPGFTAPDAHLLPGASTDADVDIMQWQATQNVHENAYSARLDYRLTDNWSSYARVFHDQAKSLDPAGRQRPFLRDHDQPDERDLQPAGGSWQRHDQRVQVRVQLGAEHRGRADAAWV